jgi:phospholipid/cholesterol/gamma-HCH transport system ATP-binding protein
MGDERDIILSVRDIVMRFKKPEGDFATVLNGISFDVFRGETLVIMGGSGCGKSTLLNCLIGELIPTEGTITYKLGDADPVEIISSPSDALDEIRKNLGILFQSGALFNSLTVSENVALPLREHSHVDPKIIDIVVAMKLQQVHMLPHRDKYPSQLSGGQKKRVGLARATALDPQILYYDEPSAGLDPVTSASIDALIMDLSGKLNVTSVVVTHEMDSAFRIADRMIMLDKGRVLRSGPRRIFEEMRDADPSTLSSYEERMINQFLNGASTGPLTDSEGLSEYEKILVQGGFRPTDSTILPRATL